MPNLLFLWLLLIVLFLYHSNNLLLSLLVLEIMGFMIIYFVSFSLSVTFLSDFVILFLFATFVIEGVIALSGLIVIVSFSGSDYISSSSILNS